MYYTKLVGIRIILAGKHYLELDNLALQTLDAIFPSGLVN